MTVRAKIRILEVKHHYQPVPGAVMAEVRGVPVHDDGETNKSWSKWTPSGEVKLTITNPDAIDQFSVGACYFVDFTPAD